MLQSGSKLPRVEATKKKKKFNFMWKEMALF
jgi:hypothetical protein